jgi:anti-sigma-K factor RskA
MSRRDDPLLQDQLAARYALGAGTASARRRLERAMLRQPYFASAVAEWQQCLARLAMALPPVEPSARVWAGVERRLPGRRTRPGTSWRGWWGALMAGMACAWSVAVVQPSWITSVDRVALAEDALPQSYVGVLSDPEGKAVATVTSTRHGHRVFVKLIEPMSRDPLELQVVDAAGAATVVGSVSGGKGQHALRLEEPADRRFRGAQRLRLVDASGVLRAEGPCARAW